MNNIEYRILFLGYSSSPALKWLRSVECFVMQTSEKISKELIHSNNINFIVSYGYRHLISKDILELLPDRAINLHLSYLPFNKGADPNLWSFIENTPKGVTIHYLDEGIDTGDIIVQKRVDFDMDIETLASSYEKLQLTILILFKKNWEEIKTLRCSRQKQASNGTAHFIKDKRDIDYLLQDGWDTPVSLLDKYRLNRT